MKKAVNGVLIEMSAEEEAEAVALSIVQDEEYAAVKYLHDRITDYPSITDQLDQIFHEGIDAWKETIQAVKDAHPKP